ncbi:hypothetical protein GCM10027189_36910 [Rufibacter soli]
MKAVKRILLPVVLWAISFSSFGQSAADLNRKSKEHLAKNDFKGALPLLKKAAELGNPEAQYNYGFAFQQGLEVAQNDQTANEWFLKAANQGYRDAQYKIAYSFATGRGIKQDHRKAFSWSLKCAELKDTDCMVNVITSYLQGYGTEKSIDSMLIWARRLGALENPENLDQSANITSSRLQLAQMYQAGKYVPKNAVIGYTWFLLYNEGKRDFSVLEQQKHFNFGKELEKNLTQAQRATAQAEAEKIIGRPLKNLANLYRQDI